MSSHERPESDYSKGFYSLLIVALLAITVAVIALREDRSFTGVVGDDAAALPEDLLDQHVEQLYDDQVYGGLNVDRSDPRVTDFFIYVIAPRRTVDLIELVQDLSDKGQRSTCKIIFEKTFDYHQSVLGAVMRREEDPSAPPNDRSMLGSCSAVSTAVFLSAHFGDVRNVVKQLQDVEAFADFVRDRMDARPADYSSLSRLNIGFYLEPSVMDKLSFVRHAVDRDPSLTVNKRNRILGLLDNLPKQEIALLYSDSMSELSKLRYLDSHVRIDPDEVRMTLTQYRARHGAATVADLEEIWANIINVLEQ